MGRLGLYAKSSSFLSKSRTGNNYVVRAHRASSIRSLNNPWKNINRRALKPSA
jgi:hypothetical protein